MASVSIIIAGVMAFVALAVGLLIYASISNGITCPELQQTTCNQSKATAWTVLAIIPFVIFMVVFMGMQKLHFE
jgi:hypothetical protein